MSITINEKTLPDDSSAATKSEPERTTKEKTPDDSSKEDNAPPPQPNRPVDSTTKVISDLRDAFPNIEDKYITAVLIASQGSVDPAFNALLYISDPTFQPEIPKPRTTPDLPRNPTLTDDELLARKLQKEFQREDEIRRRKRHERAASRDLQLTDAAEESPDEFDQIKETFTQGIEEARTTLNGWVSGLAKRLDSVRGDLTNDDSHNNPKLFGALGGSSFQSEKVLKTARFDEDPQIINDLRSGGIHLDDHDTPPLPSRRTGQLPLEKGQHNTRQWQPVSTEQQANSDAFLVTDSEEEDGATSTSPAKK